jgi:hypothetical protein
MAIEHDVKSRRRPDNLATQPFGPLGYEAFAAAGSMDASNRPN